MAMGTNRLATIAGLLLAAVLSAAWTHGSRPPYSSWLDVAKKVPCDQVVKVGNDVKILGQIIVDNNTYEQYTITDEKLIKLIDNRCHLKR